MIWRIVIVGYQAITIMHWPQRGLHLCMVPIDLVPREESAWHP